MKMEQKHEIVSASTRMPVKDVVDYFQYIDELRSNIMKQGIDYDIIPGTKKPTLLKPGAEKLAFAFKLSAEYEIVSTIEDHDKDFDYTVKTKDGIIKKKAKGFFFYKVKCRLIHRDTGIIVADMIGSMSSYERGREEAPANTILKMAEKRAFIGAILAATFSSDRFSQDLEDYVNPADAYDDSQDDPATEKQLAFISKLLKSHNISENLKNEIESWAAGQFQGKRQASEYIERLKTMSRGSEVKAEPENIIDKVLIESMEREAIELDLLRPEDIDNERIKYAGNIDLSKCSTMGLKNYFENLDKIINGRENGKI